MQFFDSIDRMRRTAIYVRISTASQKTDRQQEELTSYAELNHLNFNRNLDVFIDVVSGFKDGEERPNFSAIKNRKTTQGGPCVLMSKLDGLVLHLCIKKFAQYDLVKKSESKIKELDTAIAERSRVYDGYVTNQKEATELYSRQVKRAIKYSISDDDADSLIQEAKAEYEKKIAEYSETLNRLRNEMSDLSRRKRSLLEIKDEKKVIHKMDEIMADQSRVKEYIHDYVTQIILFKPDDSWVLVVVQFLDGSERWGTIKTERYKKSELSNDDLFSKFNYVCWMVNNDSHRFVYDRDTRQFSEIKYNRTVGRYTFEEFDRLVKERGMVSEFSPYEFKMEKE